MKTKILLTGGAGFIGSNFIKTVACAPEQAKSYEFVILDALTYAGHFQNIEQELQQNSHLSFEKIDLRFWEPVAELFQKHQFQGVLHFAAESHVDRSITNPGIFVETNVMGTHNLLRASLDRFSQDPNFRFLQVSTDEVYGSLNEEDSPFSEESPLRPSGPYSASKASADLLVSAYGHTYQLPVLITRCSNNYGPYQYPEKFIPLMIFRGQNGLPLPLYGRGQNIRDWIYVDGHNWGVWTVFKRGQAGHVYNLGGHCEKRNIDVAKIILQQLGQGEELLQFVEDRLGHDYRYAIDFRKAQRELGWAPRVSFTEGLHHTVQWYQNHQQWTREVSQKK